jgi:hypothetical protein
MIVDESFYMESDFVGRSDHGPWFLWTRDHFPTPKFGQSRLTGTLDTCIIAEYIQIELRIDFPLSMK